MGRILRLTVSLLAGLVQFLLAPFRARARSSPVILLYHAVASDQRARFARQMDTLIKRATPVAIGQGKNETIGRQPVSVTFDDGYRSFRENVLPELVKRNIPAAVFVPSRLLGEKPHFSLPGRCPRGESIMTAQDLLGLPPDLITVGSHCRTHLHLPLLNEERAWSEIAGSRKDLEHLLGRTVDLLAVPYGEYDQKILDLSRQAGYQRVFSALPTGDDGFLSGRIETSPDDWPVEFRLKLVGAYRWLPWAVCLKRSVCALFTGKVKEEGARAKASGQ